MNKNNGISAFKISQTQHKRMKMALWGIGILLAFQSIMDPLFHLSPYNVVLMLLVPISLFVAVEWGDSGMFGLYS